MRDFFPAVQCEPLQAAIALLQLLLPRQAQGPGRPLQLPGRQAMDEEVRSTVLHACLAHVFIQRLPRCQALVCVEARSSGFEAKESCFVSSLMLCSCSLQNVTYFAMLSLLVWYSRLLRALQLLGTTPLVAESLRRLFVHVLIMTSLPSRLRQGAHAACWLSNTFTNEHAVSDRHFSRVAVRWYRNVGVDPILLYRACGHLVFKRF